MIFNDVYGDQLLCQPRDLGKLEQTISSNDFINHMCLLQYSGIKPHIRYNKQIVIYTLLQWLLTICDQNEICLVDRFTSNIKTRALIEHDKFCLDDKLDIDYDASLYNQLANQTVKLPKDLRKKLTANHIDIFFPNQKVALAINMYSDSAYYYMTNRQFIFERTETLSSEDGIRVINIFEDHFLDHHKLTVLTDIITHALHKTTQRIYARDTEVVVDKALNYKWFFEKNNIQSYRNARTAFMLVLKKDLPKLHLSKGTVVMGYTVGTAHFGKGKYDAEIARGACMLGYSVIGGASKLWKKIIDYYSTQDLMGNPGQVNSIVYYSDNNYYDGKSVQLLPGNELIVTTSGFWNYWCEEFKMKNREPMKHKEVVAKTHAFKDVINNNKDENGRLKCNFIDLLYSNYAFEIWNAGTHTYVWEREKQSE